MPELQAVGFAGDVGEHIVRGAADVRRHGESGEDAALEARDAHHEELVEVAREDREEVRALEDRQPLILGQFEHALVEREPAELAVEIAVVGQLRVEGLGQVEVVVVRIAEARVEHLVFDHPLIIAGRRDGRVNLSLALFPEGGARDVSNGAWGAPAVAATAGSASRAPAAGRRRTR